jgi:hypothetical protein
MYVYIPKPVVAALAALAGALALFMIREEGPALYRYLFKFESM